MKRAELSEGTRVMVARHASSAYCGRVGTVLRVGEQFASIDFDSPPERWPKRQRVAFWLLEPAPRALVRVAMLSVEGPSELVGNALVAFSEGLGTQRRSKGGRS